ncbi:hypothetical protein B0T21DRAFT_60644 [Apiosordaria backusii]|uniref:C2H2-type domain-containing protein n=1 Tax=Apiosordaria backusii TaxID=314023 RepID=A0AA40ANG0_9PEZI|nr:hypothetical protein B0T21DRAFT_60644 [Apiosordaria backusii]
MLSLSQDTPRNIYDVRARQQGTEETYRLPPSYSATSSAHMPFSPYYFGRQEVTALGANNMRCLDCPALQFKTIAELKKHICRHEKLFKCDISDCPKAIEGFSTNNDLNWHKAALHKILEKDAPVDPCYLGMCKEKPKIRPRHDNFKQHLKRVHQMAADVDLSPFLCQPGPPEVSASLGSTGIDHKGDREVLQAKACHRLETAQAAHDNLSPSIATSLEAHVGPFIRQICL